VTRSPWIPISVSFSLGVTFGRINLQSNIFWGDQIVS
jgi:hypothetical protein